MADYGLLGGLGAGLQAGVQSYQKQRGIEEQRKQAAFQRKMAKQKAQYDPLKTELAFEKEGYRLEEDPETGKMTKVFDEKLYQKALERARAKSGGMTPMKQAQFKKLKLDIKQKEKALSGKKEFSAKDIQNVNEGAAIPNMLQTLSGRLNEKKDMMGPVGGRLRSWNPYDTEAKVLESDLRMHSQLFGKYMEGGVLRKEDEQKYRKMFPQITDTPDVAEGKMVNVRRLLETKLKSDLKALAAGGYDTTPIFEANPIVATIMGRKKKEGLMQRGLVKQKPSGGLIKEAQAGPGGMSRQQLNQMSDEEIDRLYRGQ